MGTLIMKELSDLLREIKQCSEIGGDEMEFCEDFIKLQTIFNHTNQFVRSFDKISFHGGENCRGSEQKASV